MILPERLSGNGITLRRWRPSDAERLHHAVMESLDHLRPWMDWVGEEPLTVEQRRTLLEGWERTWRAGGGANYAVLVEGETVAGGCGLYDRRGPNALEIGYWTHPRFLRRGIASAAARLLTDAAFSVPGIERVEIHHDRANLRSRGVPERLGFEFAGEAPDRRAAPAEMGIDCAWQMGRSAWSATRWLSTPGAPSRSVTAMTSKAAFNADDWSVVVNAPYLAAMLIISASRGGRMRETLAIAEAYASARRHYRDELLQQILTSPPSLDPTTAAPNPDQLHQQAQATLRHAISILQPIATETEVNSYKRFIYYLAETVARAHREGSFLGIGGQSISDPEQALLDEIGAILDEPAGGPAPRGEPSA